MNVLTTRLLIALAVAVMVGAVAVATHRLLDIRASRRISEHRFLRVNALYQSDGILVLNQGDHPLARCEVAFQNEHGVSEWSAAIPATLQPGQSVTITWDKFRDGANRPIDSATVARFKNVLYPIQVSCFDDRANRRLSAASLFSRGSARASGTERR